MTPSEETDDHLPLSVAKIFVCFILSLSFVLGIPGNSLVIWTICTQMKKKPPTAVLILHLAVADLLVLLTLPIWIYSLANQWLFGVSACKGLVFVIYCSMYASIFLITCLSLERFLAVIHPFALQRWKKTTVIYLVIIIIWLFSIVLGSTVIPFQTTDETHAGLQCAAREYATVSQEVIHLLSETILGFIVPFTIISICYIYVGKRIGVMACPSKRRSARLITSVVVIFCLCWFPHHFINLITVISVLMQDSIPETAKALENISNAGVWIAGAIIFISSCINPLLYAFAARNIRSSARFTKLSKLFEQVSPSERQESTQETTSPNEKEETLTSTEVI
ncbi:leukotriene B4 receptor 1-like [Python bivittatus]|uniref:Leukotriene B4 receptor 1-like n=1 Tax=Python bivittatus TaxID=176946 RepID=A0A9F2WM27_PYTBI|nr:leukotriene B4 receptor 1-like [Python bivittatus]XP_025032691.1 leukotriene B4 receptor 1-like [Python bivittatus]